MKRFMRGLLACGTLAVASTCASAADAKVVIGPTNAPVAAPVGVPVGVPVAGTSGCGCETDGVAVSGSAGRVFGGRLGGRFGRSRGGISGGGSRLDALGARADGVAEAYLGFNQRIGGFFEKIAGPPVDVAAAGQGKGGKGGPYTQPGTLVFPQHPFVRSPRDYFMED